VLKLKDQSMAAQQTSGDSSPRYLERGALVMVLGIIGGFGADYAFNLTLSRLLPPHDYGDFKVAYAFAFLCSVLVVLGGDRAAPKFLSAPLAEGDNRGVWEYLWFYIRVAGSLSAAVIAVTVIVSLLHVGAVDLEHHHPLLYVSFVIPLMALGGLLSRLLQAAKLLGAAVLPWRIALPLLQTGLVVSLGLLVETLTLVAVIAAAAAAVAVVLYWQWRRARRARLIALQRHPELLNTAAALKVSVPMMAAMLAILALNQMDLFMFEALGDEHEVGYFAAAATTSHMVILAQVTIVGIFTPLIAPAMAAGTRAADSLFWRAQRLVVFSSLPLAAGLILFGGELLSLFGEGFEQATVALRILTLAYAASALAALCSIWLQYSAKGRTVVAITAAALLIDAVGNYLLIPEYGLNGAASATAAAMIAAAIATWFAMYRERGAANPALAGYS
jgi:O-antigen/teichoic acid export membrane protein